VAALAGVACAGPVLIRSLPLRPQAGIEVATPCGVPVHQNATPAHTAGTFKVK
jgi:hypothetical protein